MTDDAEEFEPLTIDVTGTGTPDWARVDASGPLGDADRATAAALAKITHEAIKAHPQRDRLWAIEHAHGTLPIKLRLMEDDLDASAGERTWQVYVEDGGETITLTTFPV